jgi:acyl-CoA dehydrogenase
MRRRLLTAEHESFRESMRAMLEKEAAPFHSEWEEAGRMPASFFRALGATGLFGLDVPERFGGAGPAGYGFKMVAWEEAARLNIGMATPRVHTDVIIPYFLAYGAPEQQDRWLPRMVSGETMSSIAMSEPDTGSDLAGISTTAVRDGDHYMLTGNKTYITAGLVSDLVVVVARTSRPDGDRRGGLSLLVVESGMDGFTRGRALHKLGQRSSDTAELFFDGVRVPVANRLGEEGQAFSYLMHNLPKERLAIAVAAVAMAAAALAETVEFVRNRPMFGTTLASMQNTKFVLAGLAAQIEAGQAMVDRAVEELDAGDLDAADAARVKLFCSELQGRVVDECLQLHGGFGYMRESAIAQMYADARVTRIFGGSSEIMKVVIARSLGL